MNESFKRGFINRAISAGLSKEAADNVYQQLPYNVQNFMGVYPRRDELTPEETKLIQKGRSQLIPKIMPSLGDSPTVEMASPVIPTAAGGLIGGAAGTGLGVLGGSLLAQLLSKERNSDLEKTLGILGAAAGGLSGAGLGGFLGHRAVTSHNDSVEETMRHLKPNPTRRDYLSDPVIQRERDRQALMAAGAAAGAGRY